MMPATRRLLERVFLQYPQLNPTRLVAAGLLFSALTLLLSGLTLFPDAAAQTRPASGKKGTGKTTPPLPPAPTPTPRRRVITNKPVPLVPAPKQETPAQTQPEPVVEEEDVAGAIRITSNLVAVPVSVTDGSGNPISDLSPLDFRLEEEGREQKIEFLGEPGKTPVDMVVLFDISGSVQKRFAFEQHAVTRFLRMVFRPGDSASMYSIGLTPKLIQERTQDPEKAVLGAMSLQPTREGTAVFDAVARAVHYLRDTTGSGTRRVIVAITDGEDNSSDKFTMAETLREFAGSDCLFYAINPSGQSIWMNRVSSKAHDNLREMASRTGGQVFLPEGFEELEIVFNQIASELQAQYLIGYYPSEEQPDGKFRRITVKAPRHPELRIRARQGYYAPKG